MIERLAEQGFAIIDDWLPAPELQALVLSAQHSLAAAGKAAGIGRSSDHLLNAAIRGDRIAWLSADDAVSATLLRRMEQLRVELNHRLFLGLFGYECHYACYEPGARYHKHVDAFKGERNRLLSTVLYLNENWHPREGGELVLYRGDDVNVAATVLPQQNRLVIFLSEEFPHEVKPATRQRYSIAGWFRGA